MNPPYRRVMDAPPLLTARQMQQWDEAAIQQRGIPERVLMESAGRAAARIVHRLFPDGRVVAAVGRGNNGGDALVLLRTLHSWGRDVMAVPVPDHEVRGELLHGWTIPVARGEEAFGEFRDAAVVIDGLLGTGASGAPREPQAAAIRAMAAAARSIVALDGPSGVDLTSGRVEGEAVQADHTITFGALKRGLLLHPGRSHAGEIFVVETGFPPLAAPEVGTGVITDSWTAARWRPLPADAHKGIAGRLVILAGSETMGGAALMCGHAALRAGAGTVRVITHGSNRLALHAALPEALFTDRDSESLAAEARRAAALVAGPGIGTDSPGQRSLRELLSQLEAPLLLDADALTLLSRDPALLPDRLRSRCVLTPHPAEMGRLLDIPIDQVTGDPFAAAEAARDRFGCTVLLKGAPTLVAAPGEPTLANTTGHSGAGVGGMGDTLAGLIGALLARGFEPYVAAAIGIHRAGMAADRLGRGRPILPRDVAELLPEALSTWDAPEATGEVLLQLPPAT